MFAATQNKPSRCGEYDSTEGKKLRNTFNHKLVKIIEFRFVKITKNRCFSRRLGNPKFNGVITIKRIFMQYENYRLHCVSWNFEEIDINFI